MSGKTAAVRDIAIAAALGDERELMAQLEKYDALIFVACSSRGCGRTVPRIGDSCIRCMNPTPVRK